MRILLEGNIPVDFAKLLTGHEIATVHSLGWSGISNGELLRHAQRVIDVFLTLDRNLEFQQNVKILPFGIVLVRARSNRIGYHSISLMPHVACRRARWRRSESNSTVSFASAPISDFYRSDATGLPIDLYQRRRALSRRGRLPHVSDDLFAVS